MSVTKSKNNKSSVQPVPARTQHAYITTNFRYADQEHYDLVSRAAQAAKSSINGWLIRVTLAAARRELKIK